MNEKNTLNILREDVVIPEIVQDKANAAFSQIHREAADTASNTETAFRKKTAFRLSNKKHRRKIITAAAAAVLAVCTVTAGAAAYMKWSSGLEKELQITEKQKETAENSGLADFPEQSITQNGVTVTAQQSIVDNYYAYLSFKVEGYSVEEGIQPEFDAVQVLVDGQDVTLVRGFYDGLIMNTDGRAVRADGSEIPLGEDGNLLIDYTQDDGTLDYRINLSANGEKGAFLGKTIHVEFTDLGCYKGENNMEEIETEVEGTWAFDWTLQGDDSIYTTECSVPLGDTGTTIIGAEISPISIKAIYDHPKHEITETGYRESQEMVDGELQQISEPFEYTYYAEPPALTGVKLKDGTLLPNLFMGPGQEGYTDEDSTEYISMFAINQILDIDEVQSLLFKKSSPEGNNVLTEENLYIVDIR